MSTLALYVQGDIYPSGTNNPSAVVAAITGSKLTKVARSASFHLPSVTSVWMIIAHRS